MQEFKAWFSMGLLNPNNPFTHLSKWIFVDKTSTTDDGNYHNNFELMEKNNRLETRALDQISSISPREWIWDPKGYYDNRDPLPSWTKWQHKGPVSYNELKNRVRESRQ